MSEDDRTPEEILYDIVNNCYLMLMPKTKIEDADLDKGIKVRGKHRLGLVNRSLDIIEKLGHWDEDKKTIHFSQRTKDIVRVFLL